MSQDTKYEIIYIIRPNIDKEAKTALVERFDTILKDSGVEVIESKGWERHRLTYKVNGFHEGTYHTANVTSLSAVGVISEFDRLAKTSDGITRYMTMKVEA